MCSSILWQHKSYLLVGNCLIISYIFLFFMVENECFLHCSHPVPLFCRGVTNNVASSCLAWQGHQPSLIESSGLSCLAQLLEWYWNCLTLPLFEIMASFIDDVIQALSCYHNPRLFVRHPRQNIR